MGKSSQREQTRPSSTVAAEEWLREAAECLVNPSRPLPPPPSPELVSTYEVIETSRRQLEESQHELIQNVEMQAMHTVGSILAHELHNLSLRLALLSQNLGQFYGDPKFLQSAKHALDDTVERMQGLVDGFRERQETVIVKIMTDVSDVLRALVRQTEVDRLIAVQLVEDYGEGTNRIWADPFFLANAFRVLLENAVHAMPEGGWLTLRTRPHAGGGVVVEIEDTGIGMTQEFIDRELFAPFRSSKGHGLGLGMYICQHIIRLHEGEIEVESQPGCGTRFRLTFPSGAEPNA